MEDHAGRVIVAREFERVCVTMWWLELEDLQLLKRHRVVVEPLLPTVVDHVHECRVDQRVHMLANGLPRTLPPPT